MTPEIQVVVHATQSWLRSSWHVQVPFAWLEACVEWLQEEAGEAARLSQQQINQQALDQWLLTDLRDLDHPVLPERLAQAQKTELSGTFCVQVDSLMDISQPAYGQLQKWRGTDCANEEVSAVTQATQRPWEARTTRMLLLQVTDGVQSLEAMEYQSIPALSSTLRPGVKLQLQGRMVCRLGVLLLGPSNIKVLGGEVEDLVDRNNQGKVLCRMLGLPEEQQQEDGEVPPAPQPGNQEVDDLELDDAELLASLEQEEVERVPVVPVGDSGYATLSEPSTQFSRSSSIRSLASAASSRREASALSRRSGLTQSNTGVSDQEHRPGNDQADSDWFEVLPSDRLIRDHNMADDDFPDEDFDDLPLEELDSVVLQANTTVTEQSNSSHRSSADHDRGAAKPQTAQHQQDTLIGSGSLPGPSNSRSTTMKRDYRGCIRERATGRIETSHELQFVTNNDKSDFMDEDVDCLIINEAEAYKEVPTVGQTGGPSSTRDKTESSVPSLTLTSPPFTYLCLLEELTSGPHRHATTEIRVKAFIVTLLGKLSTVNGLWGVCATISDGTGYLDVELSNEVLTGLLGFSVAEKVALKRDPARRAELDGGMRRCQEELVDMCCVMTIVLQPEGRKAVVTKAEPVNETVLQELEQRRK